MLGNHIKLGLGQIGLKEGKNNLHLLMQKKGMCTYSWSWGKHKWKALMGSNAKI